MTRENGSSFYMQYAAWLRRSAGRGSNKFIK